MKIFAVVITYNGLNWIDKCLGSLFGSSKDITVILVDNKSTDGLLRHVRKNYPETIIIESEINLGFGKANNIGIKYALEQFADYVLLLNQDAWVQHSTIGDLIEIQLANKEYGILSPIHLNGEGSGVDFNFSQACDAVGCPGFLSDAYLKSLKKIYSIGFVMAAIWLVPREVLEKVGLFDPMFPHYGEDTDYIQRVKYHGFKIGICPGSVAYHDRENRAPSQKRDRIIRYLSYWCILKNINSNFLISISKFFSLWSRNVIEFLIKSEIKNAILEFYDGLKILLLLPKIAQNRKYCKGVSAFLDYQMNKKLLPM